MREVLIREKMVFKEILTALLKWLPTPSDYLRIERRFYTETGGRMEYILAVDGVEVGEVSFRLDGPTWTINFKPNDVYN